MEKRIIIYLLLALMPVIVSAQGAGGQVKRPVKQQITSTTPAKKKQTPIIQKMSEGQRHLIIQNLIDNMVYVGGGTFTMGVTPKQVKDVPDWSPDWEDPVKLIAHQVTLSSFSIGKYEVTQEEWEAVMDKTPSHFKGAKRPVEMVSWDDCQEFIRKLNDMTGKRFRLPTEAEWEYAARGGNKSMGYIYAGGNNLDNVAWYDNNSGDTTHDVGQKLPNELGLYDMSGNVWEWCQDCYGPYESRSQTNPKGPSSGHNCVHRGGASSNSMLFFFRVWTRFSTSPDAVKNYIGFRLAL